MSDSTVQRWSDARVVKRNVLAREKPTNAMLTVTRERRVGSEKSPGMRTTKKHKK
jgi:hypothetical protein